MTTASPTATSTTAQGRQTHQSAWDKESIRHCRLADSSAGFRRTWITTSVRRWLRSLETLTTHLAETAGVSAFCSERRLRKLAFRSQPTAAFSTLVP